MFTRSGWKEAQWSLWFRVRQQTGCGRNSGPTKEVLGLLEKSWRFLDGFWLAGRDPKVGKDVGGFHFFPRESLDCRRGTADPGPEDLNEDLTRKFRSEESRARVSFASKSYFFCLGMHSFSLVLIAL